jgi:hypothetical protein
VKKCTFKKRKLSFYHLHSHIFFLPHGGHWYLSSNLAQAAGPFVKT